MVKMVVFDLDGTLVNSLVDLGIATNEGLKQAGLPVHPMENYNHFVGNGREMLVKRAMGEKSEDKALFDTVMNGFNTYYGAHSNDHTAEYKGCTELLEQLDKNGIMTAVLSNKPDEFVGAILANAGIAILENLDLSDIADGDYELFAFPIKLGGLEAAPCRAILFEQERGL